MRVLIDFEADIAVVFFSHNGQTFTAAVSNGPDLWRFLQKSPKTISADARAQEARRRVRALSAELKQPMHEAAQLLANQPASSVKFLANLGSELQASRKSK